MLKEEKRKKESNRMQNVPYESSVRLFKTQRLKQREQKHDAKTHVRKHEYVMHDGVIGKERWISSHLLLFCSESVLTTTSNFLPKLETREQSDM